MDRPTLIDINSVELKYCPFMISLNKCTGSCNVVMSYLQKYVFQKKQNIIVKAFNIINKKS